MAFTALPRRVSSFAESVHTELVAVVGSYQRDTSIRLGIAGDDLYYLTGSAGAVWAWGDGTVAPAPWAGRGMIAVRADDTVVVERADRSILRSADGTVVGVENRDKLIVWRGRDQLREIAIPPFGVEPASGAMVHDVLCLTSPTAGLVIIDIDSGETVRTVGQPGPGVPRRMPLLDEAFHRVAPAPRGGLAICNGRTVAIHDLATGNMRVSVDVPGDLEARELAVSPDGAFAVAATVSRAQWTVGSTGFAVFDLASGRLVTTLAGHKPYTRNAAFVCGGRLLVTASTDRTLRLWEVGTWRPVDVIDVRSAADEPCSVTAWDDHDAFVLAGECGLAYVFAVSESRRPRAPTAAPSPEPTPAAPAAPGPDASHPRRRSWPWMARKAWSRRGWRFELAETGEDQFGGIPPGVSLETWPVCTNCLHPMVSVITLTAHRSRLPLRRHAGIALFVCESCDSFEPDGGANAALLLPHQSTDRLAHPPAGIEGETTIIEERALVYQRERRRGGEIDDKVGGPPDWLQSPETPACQVCGRPMWLIAQFSDSLDPGLNFGSGVGYVFTCPDEHDARFLWQN
jgi:hypothetical protein